MYDPIVKVDVAVDDTAQLSCSQSSVEHQEVCRRLLIDRFAMGEPFEGFRFDLLQLLICEHDHHITLRLALLVLCSEVVILLRHVYQQSAAYFLMLNTGLRAGELCGIINSDIDLENRVIHLQRGVKEVHVRDGLEYVPKLEVKVGKLKSKTSKRDVPLNDTAVEMINRLREEVYLGEDKPLIPDVNGNFTNPRNMRNRFYRILDAIGLPHKGLHTFRHTFATRLINGVKQPDGSVKSLSVKQVAELLGHTTSEITELYYVKRDTTRLVGLTDSFNL